MPSAEDAYLFSHPLTRDAAYQLLPPSARARIHAAAAAVLEAAAGEAGMDAASPAIAAHLHAAASGERDPAARASLQRLEAAACTRGAAWLLSQHRHAPARALLEWVRDNPAADERERAQAGATMARSCERSGHLRDAERIGLQVGGGAPLDPSDPVSVVRAHALLVAASAGMVLGAIDAAVERCVAVEAFGRAAGDADLECNAMIALASVNARRGRMEEARDGSTRALAAAEARGDTANALRALMTIALVESVTSQHARSVATAERCIAGAVAAGDLAIEERARINLAITLKLQGRFVEAREILVRAIAIAQETGDRSGEASALINLANTNSDLGEAERVVPMLHRAIALARETGVGSTEATARANLALTYLAEKRFAEAAAETDAATVLALAGGQPRQLGPLRNIRASIHFQMGEFAQAEALYLSVIPGFQALRDLPGEANARAGLAGVLRDTGRLHESVAELRAALEIRRTVGAAATRAETMQLLAAALRLIDPASAEAAGLDRGAAAIHGGAG